MGGVGPGPLALFPVLGMPSMLLAPGASSPALAPAPWPAVVSAPWRLGRVSSSCFEDFVFPFPFLLFGASNGPFSVLFQPAAPNPRRILPCRSPPSLPRSESVAVGEIVRATPEARLLPSVFFGFT